MTVMCEFCKERPMRTLLHGAMACHECRDGAWGTVKRR